MHSYVHPMVILASVAMTSLGQMDIFYTPALVLFYLGLCRSLRYLKARFASPLCSNWYDISKKDQYEELCPQLKLGDIVEIRKIFLPDFAICVEIDREHHLWSLVLFTRRDWRNKGVCGSHEIHLNQLTGLFEKDENKDPTNGCNIRINNARDKVSSPKAVDEIVSIMQEAVKGDQDKIFGEYHYYKNNHRHCAELARYPKEALDNRLSRDRGWWLNWWFGPPHCSQWFREEHLETLMWLLRDGDIVEFDRGLYSHMAYFKDGIDRRLCHRSGCNVMAKGPVKYNDISAVINGNRFRINNSLDKMHNPIVNENRTFDFESNSACYGGYNFFLNNCQHYAKQKRYEIYFGRHLGLFVSCLTVYSLFPRLHPGDIISCNRNINQGERGKLYAVYLGKELDKDKPDQVVYSCYHDGERSGPLNVVVKPLEEFRKKMCTCAMVDINNLLDHTHPPLELEEMVDAVKKAMDAAKNAKAIDREVTCECLDPKNLDHFQNSKLFAQCIRNGTKEQRIARAAKAQSLTSRSWRMLGNLYSVWHRLVCKDCYPS